jgi:NitT/TauT family transport system substrate-binding protein
MFNRKWIKAVSAASVGVVAAAGIAASAAGAHLTGRAAAKQTTVTIAVNPYVGMAPLYLGIKEGFFKKQGINLKLDTLTSPPAVLQAVVAKQDDLGFAVLPSVITDVSKGVPIKCIGPWAGNVSTVPSERSTGIVVAGNSSIKTAIDLVGKKIAEPALGGELPLLTQAWIGQAGGDWQNVTLVPLSFPEMTQALAGGQVDAIVTTEPFLGEAVAAGDRVLNWVEATMAGGTSMTCTTANQSWISANPKLVVAFRTAMEQSLSYAAKHISQARATLVGALSLTPQAAANVPLGVNYQPKLNLTTIRQILAMMVHYKYVPGTMPLSKFMLYPGA